MAPYDPEKITFFAKTDARGQNVPFGIKAKDRTKHVYVIGKTGMGKSTLLENMAIQDIQSGEGLAFIDPHGSTAEKLLDYVPEERAGDVLYFAPFDMDHPVSFNVMEDVGPDKRHLVVSGLMSTFKKIWVDAWSARMEYILSNTLLALLEYPDSTLLGVNRMLSDKAYREKVVENISDPSVKSFWVDEFAKYNERYMQEAGDAIKNKIGQFTANPLIRNIIGQPKSSFDVRKIMDERKILIMNLSKGLVGETNANLLGSMLITRVYLSAMSRADLSGAEIAKAPNFYFYVDEFQSFANETFANILSEARKYKLNLTIAHQYIEQMEEEVRNAVFGNVGTTIAFRVGPLDAEFLETVFTPTFTITDLVNLGFAQVYLSLMIDGVGSRPFSAVTLSPIDPAHVSYRDQIIAASRRAFAHPREAVEAMIKDWHAPVAKPKTSDRAGEKSAERPRERPSAASSSAGSAARPKGEPARERKPSPPRAAPRRTDAPSGGAAAPAEMASPTPQQAPARDLADLRSVLRSLSATETPPGAASGTPAPGQKESEGRAKRQSKSPAGEKHPVTSATDGLRSALADALAYAAPPARDDASATSPKKQSVSTPARREKKSVAGADTAVSTRELERMLRITGNDNPPLRR